MSGLGMCPTLLRARRVAAWQLCDWVHSVPFKGGIEKCFWSRSELCPEEGVASVLGCGCQHPHLPPADDSLWVYKQTTNKDKRLCSKLQNADFTPVAVYGPNDTVSKQSVTLPRKVHRLCSHLWGGLLEGQAEMSHSLQDSNNQRARI